MDGLKALLVRDHGITAHQAAVVIEVMSHDTNKAIAFRMNVCEATIKYHLNGVYKRMGVKNRMGLILKVRELQMALAS